VKYILKEFSPQDVHSGLLVDNFIKAYDFNMIEGEEEIKAEPIIKIEPYATAPSYQRLSSCTHLIPQFKRLYFIKKRLDINCNPFSIVDAYNESIYPQNFYPAQAMYARWRRKWDEQIVAEMTEKGLTVVLPKRLSHHLVTTDPEGNNIVPRAEDLEGAAETLAGRLLNDASEMLEDDREAEEFYTPEELMKRRSYALNVMTHVSKMVQGKQMVAIKSNAEKRETANFMMDLMKRATAGKLDAEAIAKMKQGYKDAVEVPSNTVAA
jgi:hypothetical protein